jgi:hypothetical protein
MPIGRPIDIARLSICSAKATAASATSASWIGSGWEFGPHGDTAVVQEVQRGVRDCAAGTGDENSCSPAAETSARWSLNVLLNGISTTPAE